MRPILILLVALAGGGCLPRHISADAGLPTFPFRIGVVSDAHLTSPEGRRAAPLRGIGGGVSVAGATRPIALEDGLSEDLLRAFLKELRAQGVDVILFLGDALNSGEADKAEVFFKILREARGEGEAKLPIFVTIGRHDFLGAGIVSDMTMRERLIANKGSDKRPLSKYQYLEKVHSFNSESSTPRFRYEDNWAAVERQRHEWIYRSGKEAARQGLFLAGRVSFTGDVEADIFLADSSDFRDSGFEEPDLDVEKRPDASRGSLSTDSVSSEAFESQVDYLARVSAGSEARYRIVAAQDSPLEMIMHGPADYLGLRYLVNPLWSGRVRRGLANWYLEDGANYWLCERGKVGDDDFGISWCRTIGFRQVEVGPLVDDPQSALVVGPVGEGQPIAVDDFLAYRALELEGLVDDAQVRDLVIRLREADEDVYPRLAGKSGLARFGLDRAYETRGWGSKETRAAQGNLASFIEGELADVSQDDPAVMKEAEKGLRLRLAFIAGLKGGVSKARDPFAQYWSRTSDVPPRRGLE